jgi:hypothetical protein
LKIALSFPTLSDQYNTGPREVAFTSRAIISIGKPHIPRRNKDTIQSNIRFIIPIYPSSEVKNLRSYEVGKQNFSPFFSIELSIDIILSYSEYLSSTGNPFVISKIFIAI